MSLLSPAVRRLQEGGAVALCRAPEGYDAFVVAELTRALAREGESRAVTLVFVARDSARAQAFIDALGFAAPEIEALYLPSWDCQPYDRVSPNAAVSAERMTALARLARSRGAVERPRILVGSVSGLTQRVPPLSYVASAAFSATPGNSVRMDDLALWLESNGYGRASTVRDVGDYATRGGILDLYPPGAAAPIRLDFFGDTLESIRAFDPETQRSVGQLRSLDLVPMSEARLTTNSIRRFRQAYALEFGAPTPADDLYASVSEGRRAIGLEHWLPLLYDKLDTLFDYVGDAPFVLDARAEEAAGQRIAQIADAYAARRAAYAQDPARSDYKPLPYARLYLAEDEWKERLAASPLARLSPFEASPGAANIVDCGGRVGRNFAPERQNENANVFDAAVAHIRTLRERGLSPIVAGWSDGSRERLSHVLAEHGLKSLELVSSYHQAKTARPGALPLAVIALEQGFEAPDFAIVGEQDILGDRLIRQSKRRRRAQDVLAEASALTAGDLVVHIDHGVGRFVGLQTIEAAGAPHDCLEIHYAGGDRLFLPVENLELLSRYGSETGELDRLGGAGWQSRKARLKKRVREMAGELIRVAAQRMTRPAPRLTAPEGLYDEFCARFPYDETQDQANAIQATLDDLSAGRPMDRLVCGDVGFGKTEVALRAAFAAAINGKQTAIVVPTTLLARQHTKNFRDRFAGLPVRIGQLSRMVGAAESRETKKALAEGGVDIVIGTHAVLGKAVEFKDLGLVVVDEEQHFGVAHKERLKELRAEVHILTLSATPIPRTLQLAMTGVRDLSIIATPPVDRLAVRTFVSPFDALIVREALLRERYRGGQSFYVCPRIEDLDDAAAFLRKNAPECKFVVAHGQMAARELEDKIGAFYDGKYDILLSTAIVESGLDIPRANTLIVASRRHLRPWPALSAARPRRPRQAARLCDLHHAAEGQDHPAGGEAADGAAVARYARRRFPAREPRPRHARRRQSARRGAVRPHQGGRLRTLPADGARGGRADQVGRGRAGRGPLVADDPARRAGDDSGKLHPRPADAARPLSAPLGARGRGRDRRHGRRDRRPLRPAAAGSGPADEARRHQGALPQGECRKARRRPEGRDARLPQQFIRQPDGAGEVGRRAKARSPASAPTCASSSPTTSTSSPTVSTAR